LTRTTTRSSVLTQALFTKKRPAPVVEEQKQEKRSFTIFGRGNKKQQVTLVKADVKVVDKAAEYKKRQGLGAVVSAFDFSDVRSQSDAELLYEATYGKLEGGKMSREQYQALRRKVGGTAKDFWKTSIDVKGEYTDKGYVSEEGTSVPGLPFLFGTVGALFATVAYVASQTAQ